MCVCVVLCCGVVCVCMCVSLGVTAVYQVTLRHSSIRPDPVTQSKIVLFQCACLYARV